MASVKDMQSDVVSSIDAAKAITTDKILNILALMLDSPSLTLNFETNPMAFLLELLGELGVTYEDLQEFLTKILIWVVPALEISVKAVLLTNLKKMISCSIDPRIPEKYRKVHKSPSERNTVNEYGIDIGIESIDFLDKLSINPLSDRGKNMYFGLHNVEDVYKFARADDFDAFLWFVIHKGKFPNCALINDMSDFNDDIHGLGNYAIEEVNPTLLKELNVTPNDVTNASSILPGNTFAYNGDTTNPNVISMCLDAMRDEENRIIHNTLVPVSDDLASVNWYIRRADQLGKNLGFGWHYDKESKTVSSNKGRKYSKERAICNLQYMGVVDQAPITGLVNNKIRFTILPKPLIHIPNTDMGEPPWRFKRMLFDADGNYDPNGKYTIIGDNSPISDSQSLSYLNGEVEIQPKSGNVIVHDKNVVLRHLVECYPGLTVYEFNYDYVMGMKLFDAKSLVTALMDSVLNTRLGLSVGLDVKHQEETEAIKQIIKEIINTDDSEINDCYFSFDNTKYDTLLRKAQEKKARQQRFGNTTRETGVFDSVNEILAEYDTKTELHEQIDVLHRAITQATVTLTEGLEDKYSYKIRYGFALDLIENLSMALTMAVLSPKVMMLLEINQQLMGGTWEKITFRELIMSMRTIITDIVREVTNLIQQEILKFIFEQLAPIKEMLEALIVKERLQDITQATQWLIQNCPFIWFKLGKRLVDTNLDTVDYADIDASINNKGETPTTNNC